MEKLTKFLYMVLAVLAASVMLTYDPIIVEDGLNIEYDCNITHNTEVNTALSKIPAFILQDFMAKNGIISFTSEGLAKYGEAYTNATGVFISDHNLLNTILIVEGTTQPIEETLLHEFGHYFYYEILNNEERIRIDEIFNNTEDPEWLSMALRDDYCTVRPKEYFAEFMMYYFSAGADMVKDLCPDTYAVIEPYFEK